MNPDEIMRGYERSDFTWHLDAPFRDKFNRDHWWTATSSYPDAAALYEVARRHPEIGKVHRRKRKCGTESMLFLYKSGLRPWSELSEAKRQEWTGCFGLMKGLDGRPDENLLFTLHTTENERVRKLLSKVDRRKSTFRKLHTYLDSLNLALIAVDKSIPLERAKTLFEAHYTKLRQTIAYDDWHEHPCEITSQRARPDRWLNTILRFETRYVRKGCAMQLKSYKYLVSNMLFTDKFGVREDS